MRLLVCATNPGGGGIARFGSDLASAIAPYLSADERLSVLGGTPELKQLPGVAAVAPVELGRAKAARALANQISLARAGRVADLIHMTDHHAPLLGASALSLTIHDVSFLDNPEWFPRSVATYKRLTLRTSLSRKPRAVVCVSNHTRERLRAHHPEIFDDGRVHVIHSGLRPPPHAPAGENGAGDYFLTVSAIEPRKNHLGLLAAFTEARRAGLRLRWKVVGRPQYVAAEILAALESAEGVDVVGRVSDSELEGLYRGARFVATPSHMEGFGYPPLEAMARGVPVVCSTGSALDETAGEAGLRVPAEDREQWTEALLRMESDDELRGRLIAAGLEQVRRFTWEQAGAAYLEMFRSLAA